MALIIQKLSKSKTRTSIGLFMMLRLLFDKPNKAFVHRNTFLATGHINKEALLPYFTTKIGPYNIHEIDLHKV